MITVNGHEIDFDITAPADLQRYLAACETMNRAAAILPAMPASEAMASPDGLRAYTAYITGQCKLLTDFIDDAFGDGTCNALLGPKDSLETLMDVADAMRDAISAQGQSVGKRIAGYMPNRATRRAAAKKKASK